MGLRAVGSRRRAQLADVTAQANRGIAEITALMQDIRAGKGTVGKLMTDEQLYVDLHQFISAAREVTDGLTRARARSGSCSTTRKARDSSKRR